jgi:hypothetical protein
MKKPINSRTYFQTLNIIYFSQIFMILAFTGVVAFLISSNITPQNDAMWNFAIPLVIIVSLTLAYIVFRMLIKKISSSAPLKEKMPKYSRAVLLRSVLLEMPALLSAIVGFLTGQLYYLGVPIIIVLVFLMMRPTKNSIGSDLNLSPKERDMIDNPDAIISEAEMTK